MNAFQQRYPKAGNPAAGKTRGKRKDQKYQPMTSQDQQLKAKITTVRWTPYPPQKSYPPLVIDLWYQEPDYYDKQVYALSLLPRYAPGVAHVRRCDLRNARTTGPQSSEASYSYTSRTLKIPTNNETLLSLLAGCGTPTLRFSHNAIPHQESGRGFRGNELKGNLNVIIARNKIGTASRNYTHDMSKNDINEGRHARLWDIPSDSKDSEGWEGWCIV